MNGLLGDFVFFCIKSNMASDDVIAKLKFNGFFDFLKEQLKRVLEYVSEDCSQSVSRRVSRPALTNEVHNCGRFLPGCL